MIGIGLSSGTSADGIDAVIVDIIEQNDTIFIKLLGFQKINYSRELSSRIKDLASGSLTTTSEIVRMNYLLGDLFAEAALKVIEQSRINAENIDFIASHGQTICHIPEADLFYGKQIKGTMQIGEPAVIAKRTGITTIADFRADDVAAGGEGAPLLPYVDYLLFSSKDKSRLIQNIGGIANLAFIPKNCDPEEMIAFDSGPGNMVIDHVCSILTNNRINFDKDGMLASEGKYSEELLNLLLKDKYFQKKPPKSCGRLKFGKKYCLDVIDKGKELFLMDNDIITSVSMLTVETIARAYNDFILSKGNVIDEIIFTGGGALNRFIIDKLKEKLPRSTNINEIEDFGMTIESREAISFAVIGYLTLKSLKSNLKIATGARKRVILGKISKPE